QLAPFLTVALFCTCQAASAQPLNCQPAWSGQFPRASAVSVNALVYFDEDGPGPIAPALFAGCGDRTQNDPAGTLRRFDGAACQPVGGALDGPVFALLVFDEDGPGPLPPALFAAGAFRFAGRTEAHGIVRWDGTRWSPLGQGIGGTSVSGPTFLPSVRALIAFDEDGPGPNPPALIAAGGFPTARGGSCNRTARW